MKQSIFLKQGAGETISLRRTTGWTDLFMWVNFFKPVAFLFALMAWAGSSMGQKVVIHDPNAESRTVGSFHAIEVSDAFDVFLSQGAEQSLAVSARDVELRNHIVTEVKEGILRIGLDREGARSRKLGGKKLKAYVSFVQLDKLGISGASKVYVDGMVSGNSLVVDLSGASDFKGAVHVNDLLLSQSGASDVVITGSVANLTTITASGASDVKGYDLVTSSCTVDASGACDIRITVNKELNARASGASSIHYQGEAVIRDLHSSGASSVSKKG